MYVPHADADDVLAVAEALGPDDGDAMLVLVAEGGEPDLQTLVRGLRTARVPFFGALFPGVIHSGELHQEGAVVQTLPLAAPPHLVQGLQTPHPVLPETLRIAPHRRDGMVLVLLDGLASHATAFLGALFNRLGDRHSYFGGGGGSSTFERRPCVFTAEGVFRDAAVVALVDQPAHVGVRHGWTRVDGPLVASRTTHNVIYDLNWQEALPVYGEALADRGMGLARREDFQAAARNFPFGICRQGAEDVVREAIGLDEDDGLVCIGAVDEDTVLYVLEGERDSLVHAAHQAACDSFGGPGTPQRGFVADCVSRRTYLADDYAASLNAVATVFAEHGLAPPDGMLTVGEVGANETSYLEWYNRTLVTAVLAEPRYWDPVQDH